MNRKKIQLFSKNLPLCMESMIGRGCRSALLTLAMLFLLGGTPWQGHMLKAGGIDSAGVARALVLYRSGVEDYKARNWSAMFTKTGKACEIFLGAGDTTRACTALEAQSSACNGNDSLALSTLDRAIRLYQEGPGDTGFVYFRLHLGRMRYLMALERYAESAAQADFISTLQARLLEVDSTRGVEGLFNFMLQRAQVCRNLGNLSQGIRELELALVFDHDHPDRVRPRYVAEAHSTLSQLHRRAGNLPMAQEHHDIAHDILAKIPIRDGNIAYDLMRNRADLAIILNDARKYDQALELLRRTYADAESQGLVDEAMEAAISSNLGNVYLREGKLDSAWIYTTKARLIYGREGTGGNLVAKMEINLAAISNKRQDYPTAIQNARSAAARLTRRDASSLEDRGKAWLEAGRAYLGLGKRDSVSICLRRLQAAQLAAEALGGVRCPSGWKSAADMHLLLANFDSAEVCLRRAMQACFAQEVWHGDAARVDFELLLVESTYLALLKELGRVKEKRYQLTGCVADLCDAFRHYYWATRLLDYLDAQRQDLGLATLTHERLWRDNVGILEGAIHTAHQLYRMSHNNVFAAYALACADMSKARQQGKRSIASDAKLAALIDPALLARERTLALDLETNRRIAGSSRGEDDITALAARERVKEGKLQWQKLMSEISEQAPRYYALKYQDRALWGRVLQTCFSPAPAGQAYLEYYVGVDRVYGFLQTEEGLQIANLGPCSALAASVQAHHAAILALNPIAQIADLGKNLSRVLMPFTLPRKVVRQLTIVPDGFLNELGFHTLVWHGDLPGGLFSNHQPFWVYGPAMGRGFSLTLQQAATRADTAPPMQLAEGFFPKVVDKAAGLDSLGRNPAMEELAGQVTVQEKEGPAASKQNFLASFSRWSIKEIKTHGQVADEEMADPYLLISDSCGEVTRLYASELYSVRDFFPTLLVLNACVTAKGNYLPGEGVVSLVRAFELAGCGSMLANAWYASEGGNEALLRQFYQGINQGLSGTEALRRARIALLSGDESLLRHPYYWACMDYYGAGDRPLIVPKPPRWPWILALAALAALALLVIRRIRRAA
jgi:tetratricopeptide (TPR) repeat protein